MMIDMVVFGVDVPAPAPTMAVPDSICFLKPARISSRSVGGAILVAICWGEVSSIVDQRFEKQLNWH